MRYGVFWCQDALDGSPQYPWPPGDSGHEPHGLAGGWVSVLLLPREESHPHVHVQHADGEAKIWLETGVELARAWGLTPRETAIAIRLATEHRNVLLEAWYRRPEG